MNDKLYTEVKVGNYEGELEELIKRYSDNFLKLAVGYAAVKKYAVVEKENGSSYIMVISQYPTTTFKDYNMIISMTGPNEERVKQLMQKFETKGKIGMRTPPKELEDLFKKMPAMLNQSRTSPSDN
jgi:hypothetical protein